MRRQFILESDLESWDEIEAKKKEPYGNVDYADPGYQKDKKKRYPIDTKEHVLSAISYINHPHNAAKYSPEHLAKIKSKIKSQFKKYGIDEDKAK